MQHNYPLQPHSSLELLDRTLRIYRQHFLKAVILSTLMIAPVTVFNMLSSSWYSSRLQAVRVGSPTVRGAASTTVSSDLVRFYLLLLLGFALSVILQGVILNGLLTYIASEEHFGRPVTLQSAFTAIRRRLDVLALGLVRYYLTLIGVALGLALTLGLFGVGLRLFLSLGVALAFVFVLCLFGIGLGVVLYLAVGSYTFLAPVFILERTRIREGVGRAWDLGKARFWPLFRVNLAVGGFSFLINFAILLFLRLLLPGVSSLIGGMQTVQTLLQMVAQILLAPVLPIAFTLMYYDARVRLEGLDILFQASGNPDVRPADVVSPQPQGWSLIRQDYVNMGIVSVITVIAFAVLFGFSFVSLSTLPLVVP